MNLLLNIFNRYKYMKKLISMTMLTLGLSSFSHANQNLYALNSAESEAYLVNVQQGRGNQSICTYRSATRLFGVHQVQASMQNGCLRQVAYMATYDGGGILRVLGTSNRLSVKRMGYRPSTASTPSRTSGALNMQKTGCNNPNVSETFDPSTGEHTNCRTGKVTISPEIQMLKEKGLWNKK